MKVVKQNSTHKAIQNDRKNRIEIWSKGLSLPETTPGAGDALEIKPEYLYSIPIENKDDLFSIFENLDEQNRINIAEANEEFKNYKA